MWLMLCKVKTLKVIKFFQGNQISGILTKLDGDSRGGSALSIKSETDIQIKFWYWEKISDVDLFTRTEWPPEYLEWAMFCQ